MTLSRNPWHTREYTATEFRSLCSKYFQNVEMKGIKGNEKVMEYYNRNKIHVNQIMRFDFLDLQHRLPSALLKVPYDLLNRINRNKLKMAEDTLVKSIHHEDYLLAPDNEFNLDLFCILIK